MESAVHRERRQTLKEAAFARLNNRTIPLGRVSSIAAVQVRVVLKDYAE